MRIGVTIGYWGLDLFGGDSALRFFRQIEDLDVDSLWVAEAYGSDASTILGVASAATSRIALGASVLQVPARAPAMTAMTAATLDRLSAGRFHLGLGLSNPQVAEGWYGAPFAQPLRRLEEYVAVVRSTLSGDRLHFRGETFQLPLPGGLGKPLKLMIETQRATVPVYLAGLGPKAVALAGKIADGWLPAFFAPEHAVHLLTHLTRGAASAGRDLRDIEIAPIVSMWIDDDHEAARDRMRHSLALYIGGMGSRERNFYADLVRAYGFEATADKVQGLYLAGLKAEAAAAIPAPLIDLVALCGPDAHIKDRLQAYEASGVTSVIVSPATTRASVFIDQLNRLTEIAG